MKRSEAVEEIRKILAVNGKDNGEGELEEAILHHLEVLGMLPPTVKGGSMNGWNRWEPEKNGLQEALDKFINETGWDD